MGSNTSNVFRTDPFDDTKPPAASAPAARLDAATHDPPRGRMRASDVPTPRTLEEARAAIALAETTLEGIEETEAVLRARGDTHKLYQSNIARSAWAQKQAECEFMLARFQTGETRDSIELTEARARIAELERRLADAQGLATHERNVAGRLRVTVERGTAPSKGQSQALAEMQRAIATRDARITQLSAQLAGAEGGGAVEPHVNGAAGMLHDLCALTLEVLDESERAGMAPTLLARALRRKAAGRVAASYVTRWRAEQLPLVRGHAEAQEARSAREAAGS